MPRHLIIVAIDRVLKIIVSSFEVVRDVCGTVLSQKALLKGFGGELRGLRWTFRSPPKLCTTGSRNSSPENVSKIIGYLLLQDHGEREMIRLAFSPDNAIHSLITKAKSELGLSKPAVSVNMLPHVNSTPTANIQSVAEIPVQFTPFSPASAPALSPRSSLRISSPYWESQVPGGHVPDDFHLINQVRHLGLEDPAEFANSGCSEFMGSYYFPEAAICAKSSRRSPEFTRFSC
ncbi:hypothetical protein NL676_000563 [Syzygium grande]|nr:hypothetical protein NL676_000563 [Syzygium grande]